jgi:cytochrome c biogenesis protein
MKNEAQKNHLLDALWDFFASVKLTVGVLILLAATSVIGTLIPQKADPAQYLQAYGEFLFRLLQIFDIFDMYYSWWFQALIVTLTLNISVCTLKRWPSIWKTVSSSNLKFGSIGKSPISEYSDSRKFEYIGIWYESYLKTKFRKTEITFDEKSYRIVAEKGKWTRLGVPIVHLSIVIILAGALVGSLLGFDGFVNIPENGSTSIISLRNDRSSFPLGFEVQCDDFSVTFYDSGSPKEFKSSLAIIENGKRVVEKDIIVNDPLRYKGINFFQSSYGKLSPETFRLKFSSNSLGQKFEHKFAIGERVELPDSSGWFTVKEYTRNFNFRGTAVGEAILGLFEKPGKEPLEIALPIRFPTFDKMRKGEWFISIVGQESAYYTGLQVTKDPGVPLVYIGFILLIAGCFVAFFMSHQKVLVIVRPSSNSSRIQVYGRTNRNQLGFEIALQKLSDKLKEL